MADTDDEVGLIQPPAPTAEEEIIIKEGKKRYRECMDWEAQARILFDYDYKFANGDTHNKYQWDSALVSDREDADRPCLTINKTQIHNLMVINDAKQNKPGVRIRPVGDEASFDGALIFQELVYHIEYISNAESVYDNGTSFQVQAGMGYWRVNTDYINEKTFDQEIYIQKIKDPRSVYLDPNINETDGSDARFGFIFEDMPKDLFREKYPDFAAIAGMGVLGNRSDDGWITQSDVRVCEYYRKTQNKDKLITFIDPKTNQQVLTNLSNLNEEGRALAKQAKTSKDPSYKERDVLSDDIEWFKIAGDRIIDRGPWLGKYVPIVRLPGTETIIDGILDRKGHTRALIDAQRMYNYNTSANVEYGALQTKSPWIASADSIEGYEEYYKTANTDNKSYLPYNAFNEDGKELAPPTRPAGPQASPAYVQQMQIAQNEMMMATGQYQSQLGENENAKSGVAINARQRQGDKATYHFIDNQAIAIRFTGKILIDLIPKIYDTKRVMEISASDGSILSLTVDPNAEQGYQKIEPEEGQSPRMVKGRQVQEVIFNPKFGYYDIQSDTGPSYATKRMEAASALTQVAANDKSGKFMEMAGDIFFETLDFPKADVLAERYRRAVPPAILGEGPDPQMQQAMQEAAAKIEQMTTLLTKQSQDLASKDKELDIKAKELDLKTMEAKAEHARLDYDAETKRLVALGNSGPALSVEQIQPVASQLLSGMLDHGEPTGNNVDARSVDQLAAERATLEPPEAGTEQGGNGGAAPKEPKEEPPVEGAKKAPDGNWYVKQGKGYARVDMRDEHEFHPSKIGAKLAPDGHYYVPHHGNEGKFLRVHHNG